LFLTILLAKADDAHLRPPVQLKLLDTGYECDEKCMASSRECKKCELDEFNIAFCKKGKLPKKCREECCDEVVEQDGPPERLKLVRDYTCDAGCMCLKSKCRGCEVDKNDRAYCKNGVLPEDCKSCCEKSGDEEICIKQHCSAKCQSNATASCEANALATCKAECGKSSVPSGFVDSIDSTGYADASAEASSSAISIGGASSTSVASADRHGGGKKDASCGGSSSGLVLTVMCPQCDCCGSCVAKATARCFAKATATCLAECKV
jgi:hypothetical protein